MGFWAFTGCIPRLHGHAAGVPAQRRNRPGRSARHMSVWKTRYHFASGHTDGRRGGEALRARHVGAHLPMAGQPVEERPVPRGFHAPSARLARRPSALCGAGTPRRSDRADGGLPGASPRRRTLNPECRITR